jgi:hypothetical protein
MAAMNFVWGLLIIAVVWLGALLSVAMLLSSMWDDLLIEFRSRSRSKGSSGRD